MTSRIIAVANQKGGVGKTTLTLGLAAAVANSGRRVLVVDMDPQSNASSTLLPDYVDPGGSDDSFLTTNDILQDGVDPADIVDAVHQTPWQSIDLIPAEQRLANRDVEGSTGIELRLRRMLRGLPADAYDLVLLDCPPSVGRLTVNALLAAHEILLVAGPDRYAQNALNQIGETLRIVRELHDHQIETAGLVINGFENTREARLRRDQLYDRFGAKVLLVMPKRTVLVGAAGAHQSIFTVPTAPAREVCHLLTELARSLGLIGAREMTPEIEIVSDAAESVEDTYAASHPEGNPMGADERDIVAGA